MYPLTSMSTILSHRKHTITSIPALFRLLTFRNSLSIAHFDVNVKLVIYF